jgi:hypothetical protein
MVNKPTVPVMNGAKYDFQTPAAALLPLYPFLPKEWTVWECAAGNGNLVTALKDNGYNAIGSDLRTGNDFLMYEPAEHYDCIITNPPYDLKDEFLHRAYQLNKPFAFLLPLTTFEGKKRQSLFTKHGLEVIMFDKRVNFETPDGEGKGSWFMTAWFSNGLNLGRQLTFVRYMDNKIKRGGVRLYKPMYYVWLICRKILMTF